MAKEWKEEWFISYGKRFDPVKRYVCAGWWAKTDSWWASSCFACERNSKAYIYFHVKNEYKESCGMNGDLLLCKSCYRKYQKYDKIFNKYVFRSLQNHIPKDLCGELVKYL
jgi:hypothetical protein